MRTFIYTRRMSIYRGESGQNMGKLAVIVILYIFIFSIFAFAVVRFDIKDDDEACTSVIVTGTASDGGYAILSKNRDSGDTMNKPVYHAPAGGHFGFVMVNDLWMGMNERGLAVMNTFQGALRFGGSGLDNGPLNQWIVQHCESVDQVCFELNSTASEIGPGKRVGGTCVGVIDRFGEGAFIEISGMGAYARFIIDGYDSEANHPRYYPGYASGPSGRDQYALEVMNTISTQKGKISYEDVTQRVTRYVHNREQGTASFSVSGEIPNDSTQSSFVAVSGIGKYDGKLSCFWGEYGNNPIVGLYVPSIVFAGSPPSSSQNLYDKVFTKRSYALNGTSHFLPERVREVQSYAFAAEEYTFQKYENLLSTIPAGLSDTELASRLKTYVSDAVGYAVNIYTLGAVKSGDFNGDSTVDIYDAQMLANHFNMRTEIQLGIQR